MSIALSLLLIAAIIGSIVESRAHQRLARKTIVEVQVIDDFDFDFDIADPYGNTETAKAAVLNWEQHPSATE